MKKEFIEKYSNIEGLIIEELEKDLNQFEQHIKEEYATLIHDLKIHYIQNNYPKLNGDKYLIACDDCRKTIKEVK